MAKLNPAPMGGEKPNTGASVPDTSPFDGVFALHRYFVWANYMRTCFDDESFRRRPNSGKGTTALADKGWIFMSYWYAGLYVVIEGWRELGLADPTVDELLRSPNVDLLRLYRNGVCHFQQTYFSHRFDGFVGSEHNPVEWVRELNRQFGRYFLNWHRRQRGEPDITDQTTPPPV